MTTIVFRIISREPFTIEYMNGKKSKRITYEVPLTNQEIMSEARHIVFDE